MKDMLGNSFKVGQYVAKAYRTGDLRILEVTKIVDGKVYLGKSTNPLIYPESVLILDNEWGGGDGFLFPCSDGTYKRWEDLNEELQSGDREMPAGDD